jgi:flavin-dependent dehydrogenase
MSMEDFDALIAGGGPAGAAVACHLAKAGKKTLLIEKEKHAHHKVCGEFLSFEAQTYLRELGVDPIRLGAAPLRFVRLINDRRVARASLPFTGLGLSRFVLDEQLLSRAAVYGAAIWRGHRVRRVTHPGQRWRVETNGLEAMEADAVFLATGKHDLGGFKRPPGQQNDLIGFKMHFTCTSHQRRVLSHHVDVVLFDGGYAGLQPIEDGKINLCLLISKNRFAELDKDWDALLVYLARSSPYLRAFLDKAATCWRRPVAIASLPYGYVYAANGERNEGMYRLGDQFTVIPSFSGEGMSIALHTAKLAADTLLNVANRSANFHRRAREEILPQMRAASLLARTIERPTARIVGFAACQTFPALMTHMASRTRLRVFVS